MTTRHFRQHPAYEPGANVLRCPFCVPHDWPGSTFTRVTEFEVHMETVHRDQMTGAVAETWFSPAGFAKWRARARSTAR